jgi:hypothetical protein
MTLQYLGSNNYKVFLNHQEPIIMTQEDLLELNNDIMNIFLNKKYSSIYRGIMSKSFNEEHLNLTTNKMVFAEE